MNFIKRTIYEYIIPPIGKLKVKHNHYINVIYYHDIVSTDGYSYMQMTEDYFRQQMDWIKKEDYQTYTFSELDELQNVQYQKKSLLITFDDGWLSNYTFVFDIMKQLGLKYNVFLATGLINHNPSYLTWDMVKEMSDSNLCGFGGHTYDHIAMQGIALDVIEKQVYEANILIEKYTGYYPKDFCFPFGKYDKEALEIFVKHTPYKRIYTSDLNYSYNVQDKIVFGRNGISNDESMKVFRNKVRGYYNVFNTLRGRSDC